MNRRTFLALSAGFVSAAAAGGWLLSSRRHENYELYSAFGAWTPVEIGDVDPALKSHLIFFSPRDFTMHAFEVPFRVHTGVQNPHDRRQFFLISKWGTQIALFDRQRGEVVSVKDASPGRRFFGHGAWDEGAGGVWVSEHDDRTGLGVLVLRGPDLEARREITSGGIYPHEVKMVEPGILQVANTGDLKAKPGNLSWIRSDNGHLIKTLVLTSPNGMAGPSHFLRAHTGDLFVGSMTASVDQPSAVWRVNGEDEAELLEATPGDRGLFTGEVVSFAEYQPLGMVLWTQAKTKAVFGALSGIPGAHAEARIDVYPHAMIADASGIIVTKGKGEILRWQGHDAIVAGHGPDFSEEKWGSHILRAEIAT